MKAAIQSGTDLEEELKKSAKKGIFNLFNKKGREASQKRGETPTRVLSPSPMKPIKR
jgi:hypothetical protein